jgi:metal-responsive CopG/Arc/MetJ family transcriptional regulator
MKNTKRATISLPVSLYRRVKRVMDAEDYNDKDFSGFVQQALREDIKRRASEVAESLSPDEVVYLREALTQYRAGKRSE